MSSGVVVLPAGRPQLIRATYAAAARSCLLAGLELVVVSWSPSASPVLVNLGCEPVQMYGKTLHEIVASVLDRDGIVGRIDEHMLVAPQTMSVLLENLDDRVDAVCAYPWDDPPSARWTGQVVFGACHVARNPRPFVGYARWFPGWASSSRVDWVDAGVSLVGPTRADGWRDAAATPVGVQTLSVQGSSSVVPVDYGEPPPGATPGLTGKPLGRLTRM